MRHLGRLTYAQVRRLAALRKLMQGRPSLPRRRRPLYAGRVPIPAENVLVERHPAVAHTGAAPRGLEVVPMVPPKKEIA